MHMRALAIVLFPSTVLLHVLVGLSYDFLEILAKIRPQWTEFGWTIEKWKEMNSREKAPFLLNLMEGFAIAFAGFLILIFVVRLISMALK